MNTESEKSTIFTPKGASKILSGTSEVVLYREVVEVLEKRKVCLDHIIGQLQKTNSRSTSGSLRISSHGKNAEYYWHISKGNEEYISKANISKAAELAQHTYENKLLLIAGNESQLISKLMLTLEKSSISNYYEDMVQSRKKLISPIEAPDEEFRKSWESITWDIMPVSTESGDFVSDNGVRVRSKVELLIANALEKYDIPYRYEYPLYLDEFGLVRPDFICLNMKKRKEIIWEHFGMMDDPDYASKNVKKIAAYEASGYGNNMIMTFETSATPLSSSTIKRKIQSMLL